MLGTGIKQGYLTNGEAMTLSGKLNHYGTLVSGKYERCMVTHLVEDGKCELNNLIMIVSEI